MRLALVIDDYLPHSTRVGAKMFHDLALELMKKGNDVTVITPHFDKSSSRFIQDVFDEITVWRFYSGPIKDVNKIKRAINESLLSFNAWLVLKDKIEEDSFDGVIYYSPSIFFGSLVEKIKRHCSCPSYLVLRDFFPQWAIDSGMIRKGSLIERYFRFFESRSYQSADMIGVMSQRNLEIFTQDTESRYSSSVLRNWANLIPHQTSSRAINLREKLCLTDEVIFFYGGNIGHAQDMANLMRLVRGMQCNDNAHFLFIGQGDEVELIKSLATKWELENFSYLPSVNQSEFKDILAQVDIGLFSLSSNHSAHNFPGKLLGYMVQSLPILGSVNQGNDLMDLVNEKEAGLVTVNGNDNKFLENAIKLYENRSLRKQMGLNGYNLLEEEFAVSKIATSILDSLMHANEQSR
ncbi:glycosyltransferase family 4 protein [Vibrio mediterranei]|uniref:glycosyltransferase family 4 protein n=1 Tax=Vibrio mediterranei TaxID=689 RepID=UPI004068F74E